MRANPEASAADPCRGIIDLLPYGVVVTDPEGRAQLVNRSWTQLTGQDDQAWHDHGWLDSLGRDQRHFRRSGLLAAARSAATYSADWTVRRDTGPRRVLHVTAVPELVDDQLRQIVVAVTDVTADHDQTRQLAYQASHDSLTGLLTRLEFLDFVGHALERRRRRPQLVSSVVFIDVDRLKATNDTRGHDAGDLLLERVASRIEAAVRPSDVVARYGGDEFTVLCEDLHDPAEAMIVADRIRDAVNRPRAGDGASVVSVSVGVAVADDSDRHASDLVGRADRAMYRSKRARSELAPRDPDDLDLLAIAAHELRGPLTTISGLAQLLRHAEANANGAGIGAGVFAEIGSDPAFVGDGGDVTSMISRHATRLAGMLDDLLDLGRMHRVLALPEPLDLAAVIADALDAEPPPAHTTVTACPEPDDARVLAFGDQHRITRAVTNLLTNAYHHGGPNVTITVSRRQDMATVEIADDGDGIPVDMVASLYEPFASGGRRDDGRPGPGSTGLGLAIAKQAVESLGGRLGHEAVAPHGVRFTIALPLVAEDAERPTAVGRSVSVTG